MDDFRVERRLAAIMAADIVGYSRMIETDETATVQRLQALRRDFIDPLIASRQGRIVRLAGDGALVEFPSVVEATQCAIELQRGMLARNASMPDDRKIVFRIGVNLGDIVVEDDNLHGDGINVAARLEALAQPGDILVTEQVAQNVTGKVDAPLVFVEERTVKNIEHAVRIHRVLLDRTEVEPATGEANRKPTTAIVVAAGALVLIGVTITIALWQPWVTQREPATVKPIQPSTAVLQLPDKPSIAVLPFSNRSGDPTQDYFADGMTDDLITDLSKISGLFVIARNSSFSYKDRNVRVTNVAAELGVQHVLEGSVRRSGNQVRINVQLIDGATGGHLWAERYDGLLDDVFTLQDSINREIVSLLAVKLTGKDRERLANTESVNIDAYDVWLRGHELVARFNPDDNVEARDLFRQAVALDRNYARAYSSLAVTYATEVNFNWTGNPKESARIGLEYAAQAASIDETIPQIHFVRTVLYLANREYDAAISAARRAIELDPNYADGYAGLAFVSTWAGEPRNALHSIQRAMRLNPHNSFIYLSIEGHARFLLGRYNEALQSYDQALERNPAFDRGQLMRAAIYALLDAPDEAAWALDEALAVNPDITLSSERDGAMYRHDEDRERYIEALREAGLPD